MPSSHKYRPALRLLDNDVLLSLLSPSCPVFSPTVASSCGSSSLSEVPASFLGRPMKQKRRISSLHSCMAVHKSSGRLAKQLAEISTEDSPRSPSISASLLMLKSPLYSDTGSESSRKRSSCASPRDEPSAQRTRSILQPIDNESSVLRKVLTRQPSQCDTPSSFVGSPVKKKRRLSSIKRL